ncbi:hypothetical protein [Thermophilibacter provencensis]|uniref:Ig-like domain-containing protein n=1 Tax=Thermophilibacter provencensis TaxID=1852386 RepID=A0ABT7V3V3_9ACTN|nr:hypothetical protein [Thermophilibacter provencensis]MDM8270684.1 hypothetical protein [Thermophilibacter provencensis]
MKRRPARLSRALLACVLCALCALAAVGCSKSEPPTATARYESEDAVVNMGLLLHGYNWDGVANDAVAPTELGDDDVPDLEVSGAPEVGVSFSQPATEVEVVRYAEDGSHEGVECSLEDGTAAFGVEPGWRYYVGAWFEGGDAGYLFDVKGAEMGEFVSTAMVVTFGDGEVLFVDQDSESPYYPTLPEGTPELTAGNIVRVTGNGIMLESYPGQYPGITKVEVIEEGSPADAEKYDELVAEIWQPKDPSEPAFASLDYTTELAATSVMLSTYRCTWSYEEDGQLQTISGGAPELNLDELPDARIEGATEATVSFDVTPTDVTVGRRALESSSSNLDEVPCELDGKSAALSIEPGYLYVVEASFEAGKVTYHFVTLTPSVEGVGAKDPADPPAATIEYASQSVQALTCGSTWSFEQDGETLTATTDTPHPVQYAAEGMPAVHLGGSETLTMSFDVPATGATVTCWNEGDISAAAALAGSVHDVDPNELAATEQEAEVVDGAVSFEAQPDFRYAVTVTFDAGEATYAFTVPAI